MNLLKTLLLSTALTLSLSSLAANADTYNFSYTFNDGTLLSGSLSGILSGSYINNISDVHVNLNGTDFSGGSLYSATWNSNTESFDSSTPAVVSTNAALNNFIFADSNVPTDFGASNYFFFVNDPNGIGQEAFATNLNSGDIALDSPTNSSWSLVAAPVPEPETYAMLFAGLAFVSMTVRRRRQG